MTHMTRKGQINATLIISGGFIIITGLAGAIYSTLIGRLNTDETAIASNQIQMASVETDVKWIKSALQAKGFSSPDPPVMSKKN